MELQFSDESMKTAFSCCKDKSDDVQAKARTLYYLFINYPFDVFIYVHRKSSPCEFFMTVLKDTEVTIVKYKSLLTPEKLKE